MEGRKREFSGSSINVSPTVGWADNRADKSAARHREDPLLLGLSREYRHGSTLVCYDVCQKGRIIEDEIVIDGDPESLRSLNAVLQVTITVIYK